MRYIANLLFICITVGCSPEHSGEFGEGFDPNEKALRANFASIQTLLIQPKCLECHKNASSNNHHVDLTSYESIVNSNLFPPLVVPGYPEQSSLYTSIRDGRMPKNSGKLSNRYSKTIFEWIKNGAKKDSKDDDIGDGDGGGNDNDPPDCEPDEPGCSDDGEKPPSCSPEEPGCNDDDWE